MCYGMDLAVDPVAREQLSILLGLGVMVLIVGGAMLSAFWRLEVRQEKVERRIKELEDMGRAQSGSNTTT